MPRQTRHIESDTIYHVTSRGVEKRLIFQTDSDKQYFLSASLEAFRASHCSLLAHCLMGNHFHYLVATRDAGLSTPLHAALTRYAVRFNSINERVGHLFQARYYARPCFDLAHLHRVIAYIHFNPVRAGLVRHPADWGWSSHRDWITLNGTTIDFARISELTDCSADEFRESYRESVKILLSGKARGVGIPELIQEACALAGIKSCDLLAGRKGDAYTFAKRLLVDAVRLEGYSLYQLAHALNCSEAALSLLRKRHT